MTCRKRLLHSTIVLQQCHAQAKKTHYPLCVHYPLSAFIYFYFVQFKHLVHRILQSALLPGPSCLLEIFAIPSTISKTPCSLQFKLVLARPVNFGYLILILYDGNKQTTRHESWLPIFRGTLAYPSTVLFKQLDNTDQQPETWQRSNEPHPFTKTNFPFKHHPWLHHF